MHLHQRTGRRDLAPVFAAPDGTAATAVVTPAAPESTAVDAGATWASFAEAVSGEWEGVTASFDAAGEPLELPEYYVPQAYRDWGVQLFDWQSQSSVLADGSGCAATHRRMMPSVGCEADAIAFTSQAQQLFGVPAPGGPQPPVAPDGSYVSGPADISAPDCAKAAFEACLALGCGGDGAATQQPRRLRVVHNLQRVGSEGRWALDSVELHHERLDSTYRGKVELSGCGGGMKTFASADRLGADALAGAWVAAGLRYTADPAGNGCRADAVSSEAWSADTQPALLLHPLGAWSSCAIADGADGDISLAAGVLLGDSMVVATQRLVGGRLAAAELLTLQRA